MRTVHTPPKQAQELISTFGSAFAMLRDRPGRGATKHAPAGKAPFHRILTEGSFSTLQRFGDGTPGVSKHSSRRDSRRGGCAASRSMPLKELYSSELTPTVLATGSVVCLHIVYLIQAPQPRLLPGTRHKGSPPPIGLSPNRLALKRTWEAEPIAYSAIGYSTQERKVTHQLLGSSTNSRLTGHWASFGVRRQSAVACSTASLLLCSTMARRLLIRTFKTVSTRVHDHWPVVV